MLAKSLVDHGSNGSGGETSRSSPAGVAFGSGADFPRFLDCLDSSWSISGDTL